MVIVVYSKIIRKYIYYTVLKKKKTRKPQWRKKSLFITPHPSLGSTLMAMAPWGSQTWRWGHVLLLHRGMEAPGNSVN